MSITPEMIISGLVSKILSDNLDTTKSAIKRAIAKRTHTHDDIQTKMYGVVIDALDDITDNKYKDQDKLYDSAEKIFDALKKANTYQDYESAVKYGLRYLDLGSELEIESFFNSLFSQICKGENSDLYKEITLRANVGTQIGVKNNTGILKELKGISNKIVDQGEKILEYMENGLDERTGLLAEGLEFKDNKKKDYCKKWIAPLFLQEKGKELLVLKDSFIWPHFVCEIQNRNFHFSEEESLEEVLKRFVAHQCWSNMLITGVPGMGKTSIVSWIANEYENDDNVIILRFRDWEKEDLTNGLLKAVCQTLGCNKNDLSGKILIIDGFDEIKLGEERNSRLGQFLQNAKEVDRLKFIITTRPDYVNKETAKRFKNWVDLRPFDEDKIITFYEKIKGSSLDKDKINFSNREVLGIPVILYMAIMAEIDLTVKASRSELYDRIFAEDTGIWSKFANDSGEPYDNSNNVISYPDNIKEFLAFLREIAFKMFEKGDACLERGKDAYEIPTLEFEGNDVKILEFPIKHVFEQANEKIEFVHRSIYEFFAAEYMYFKILDNRNTSVEYFAGILGEMLRKNHLSDEIIGFIRYHVQKNKLKGQLTIVLQTFHTMLGAGMTFYCNTKMANILECELTVFANMLEMLDIYEVRKEIKVEFRSFFVNYIASYPERRYEVLNMSNFCLENVDLSRTYLGNTFLEGANLTGADLEGANLTRADLTRANLTRANLEGANLTSADMGMANLTSANLTRADLTGANFAIANLEGANLAIANLTGANLTRANLTIAHLKGANLEGTILHRNNL